MSHELSDYDKCLYRKTYFSIGERRFTDLEWEQLTQTSTSRLTHLMQPSTNFILSQIDTEAIEKQVSAETVRTFTKPKPVRNVLSLQLFTF